MGATGESAPTLSLSVYYCLPLCSQHRPDRDRVEIGSPSRAWKRKHALALGIAQTPMQNEKQFHLDATAICFFLDSRPFLRAHDLEV